MRRWAGSGLLLALLTGCSLPSAEPPRSFPETGARLTSTVFLSEQGPAAADASFRYPAVAGGETRVSLASIARRPISAVLSCDGAARLLPAGDTGPGLFLRPGASRRVQVPGRGAAHPPRLVLPPDTARCEITWGQGHSIVLLRDGAPAEVPATPATCRTPSTAPDDRLARAFFADRPLMQTCAAPTGPVELVPGEMDGLKWRLDRLTGGDVSLAVLDADDPDMALDFTNAPRFDEIVVSYLLVRADLSGWLTTRALAFHAARGTRVRILTTSSLTGALDRGPLEALAARYPNVELQYYAFPAQNPGGLLNPVARSNHVKLFLGLSPDPGRSFALIGGRNLTDGFYFDRETAHPDHPFLRSYGALAKGPPWQTYYSVYDDFEVALTNSARVAEIAEQFARFYTRDARGQLMRDGALPGGTVSASAGLVRHFISLPWGDGWAHEQLYADLFDAARDEIFIVSPFNYPTPAIEAALRRAAARGVDVRFIMRRGADEPPAAFTRAMNAEFQDENTGRYRFRRYQEGETLLHAKIIVIDGRLGIVASSNLNRRSYIHDTENGLIFLDRKMARALRREAERYWAMGSTGDDPLTYPFPNAVLKAVPWLEQFF